MSFDYSTLVRDRTQADVSARNAKGTYNAEDLNRVTAALDDLHQRFENAGYALPNYKRIKIPHGVPETKPESQLPEGYTTLAWIESTGTQYIDTGFKANQDTRVCVEAEVTEVPTSHSILFGGRTSGTSKSFTCWWYVASNGARFDYGAYDADTKIILPANTKLVVDANKGNCSYGSVYSETNTYGAFQCDYSLALFAVNTAGSASNFFKGKVYSCQIYDNGTLVRDYVPCRNPYGIVGLYDLVNDQFYENAGSGNFTGGETVAGETTEHDPYLWYDIDVPTAGQMAQYLTNVDAVRKAFAMLSTTPKTPASMELLTWSKANNIEQILIDVDALLAAMASVYLRSGMSWAYSGEANLYFMN